MVLPLTKWRYRGDGFYIYILASRDKSAVVKLLAEYGIHVNPLRLSLDFNAD
jgi:hypothetical protein